MVSQCIVCWQSRSCAQWPGVALSRVRLLLVVAVAGAVEAHGSTYGVVMVNIIPCPFLDKIWDTGKLMLPPGSILTVEHILKQP